MKYLIMLILSIIGLTFTCKKDKMKEEKKIVVPNIGDTTTTVEDTFPYIITPPEYDCINPFNQKGSAKAIINENSYSACCNYKTSLYEEFWPDSMGGILITRCNEQGFNRETISFYMTKDSIYTGARPSLAKAHAWNGFAYPKRLTTTYGTSGADGDVLTGIWDLDESYNNWIEFTNVDTVWNIIEGIGELRFIVPDKYKDDIDPDTIVVKNLEFIAERIF